MGMWNFVNLVTPFNYDVTKCKQAKLHDVD